MELRNSNELLASKANVNNKIVLQSQSTIVSLSLLEELEEVELDDSNQLSSLFDDKLVLNAYKDTTSKRHKK